MVTVILSKDFKYSPDGMNITVYKRGQVELPDDVAAIAKSCGCVSKEAPSYYGEDISGVPSPYEEPNGRKSKKG